MYDDYPRNRERNGNWFWYAFILAAVAGGIYYFWHKSFDFTEVKKILDNKSISSTLSGIANKVPEKTKNWKEKIDAGITSGIGFITKKPKEIAGNFLTDIKNTALESARKQADQVLGVGGGGGGAPVGGSGSGGGPSPSNISIVRPARQSLSLLITAENEDIVYSIGWGDSVTDTGSVAQKTNKTIEHVWAASGDYTVKVNIEGKTLGKQTFVFPITILK